MLYFSSLFKWLTKPLFKFYVWVTFYFIFELYYFELHIFFCAFKNASCLIISILIIKNVLKLIIFCSFFRWVNVSLNTTGNYERLKASIKFYWNKIFNGMLLCKIYCTKFDIQLLSSYNSINTLKLEILELHACF